MNQPINVLAHVVDGQHYILIYYDTEYWRDIAVLALDQWRCHHGLNFARQDMDAMAEMIYDQPVASPRFNLPMVE